MQAIAHVDLIEQALLEKNRDEVTVHLYIAPDENFAEIAELMQDRLTRAEVPYALSLSLIHIYLHYHKPPDYLVFEPEDTSERTANLQQTNTNGYKLQQDKCSLSAARRCV